MINLRVLLSPEGEGVMMVSVIDLRRAVAASLLLTWAALGGSAEWEYVKSVQIPRPYVPILAAVTPTGDCVVATFNNTRDEQPVELPVIYIHKPLTNTPSFYIVCKNKFPALRGYSGVAVDSAGCYYVSADTGGQDSWIRKFLPNGKPDPQFGVNGEVRPGRRVLGLDIAGNYLFTTFGFAELACYDARTGQLIGRVVPPEKNAPPIHDIAVDTTRELIFGVANGAAWVWRGGKFSNLAGYRLERLSEDLLKEPKVGEGVYFDAFGKQLLMAVGETTALYAADLEGKLSKSEITGGGGLVQAPADVVLLTDGETVFMPDKRPGPSGECLLHVMKRAKAVTRAAGDQEATLPSLAAAGLLRPASTSQPQPSPVAIEGSGVAWRSSFEAARDESKKVNKPIFLYARTSVAKPCQDLEANFLKSTDFAQVAAKVIPVFFDVTTDPKLAQQLGIFRVPFMALYRPDGERVELWMGKNIDTTDVLGKLSQAAR